MKSETGDHDATTQGSVPLSTETENADGLKIAIKR